MEKLILCFIVMLLSFAYSCKDSPDVVEHREAEVIKINIPSENTEAEFDDYFSESVLVPLATTPESLIETISRIIIKDKKIYILDTKTNSVLIFHDDGRFIQKIQRMGRGPGEYESVMDFTIEETTNNILVHTDRPYKLLTFSAKGEFLREEILSGYYSNMSFLSDKLLFLNKNKEFDNLLIERDIETREERGYIPFDKWGIYYANVGTGFPYILKSKNTYAFFPYSNLIYEYLDGGVKVKYMIDFGDKNPPSSLSNMDSDPVQQYISLLGEGYGMGISNFKETDDYIAFRFGWSTMALYNKNKKEAQSFHFITNDQYPGLFFNSFFAHDGDDNTLISITQVSTFNHQMEIFRSDLKVWNALDDKLKSLADNVKEDDNPLLLMYTLR